MGNFPWGKFNLYGGVNLTRNDFDRSNDFDRRSLLRRIILGGDLSKFLAGGKHCQHV